MKKAKNFLISLLIVCIGVATLGFAGCKEEAKRLDVDSFTKDSEGLELKFNSSSNSYSVESIGSCTDEVLVIPQSYQGYPVVRILREAFQGNKGVKGVIIPGSIERIDNSAFLACYDLVEVVIKEGVKEIWELAFYNCNSLKYVELPDSLTTIFNRAFEDCEKLESIEIPQNVTMISNNAFKYCSSLKEIAIPQSVTYLGHSIFAGCRKLSKITYEGTMEEWNEIKKGYTLTEESTPAKEVICSDGSVPIE